MTFAAKFQQRKGVKLTSIPEICFKEEEKAKPQKQKRIPLRYFFDFETTTSNKKADGTNDIHEAYGCAVYRDDQKKQWFEGEAKFTYDYQKVMQAGSRAISTLCPSPLDQWPSGWLL